MGAILPFPTTHRPSRIIFGRALVARLVHRAAELTGIGVDELKNTRRRTREVSFTRFAIMRVARENGHTLTMIGRALGGFDHTSIINGLNRCCSLEIEQPDFAELIDMLRQEAGR